MSEAQKQRLSQSAAWKSRSDYERHVKKLFALADCPFVTIFASSGGPSTECSFGCNCKLKMIPDCPSFGSISGYGSMPGCQLISRLVQRKRWAEANDVRFVQIHKADYVQVIEGAVGWMEVEQT
jgi:hypothetical protein